MNCYVFTCSQCHSFEKHKNVSYIFFQGKNIRLQYLGLNGLLIISDEIPLNKSKYGTFFEL